MLTFRKFIAKFVIAKTYDPMAVTIKKVESRRDRRAFVKFPLQLYKGCPYYVPSLFVDEMSTLNPKLNPSADFCDSELYLAYKDGKIAGRVAAIINRIANRDWHHAEIRYGWFDFIDDREVSAALLDAVIAFGKAHGMTRISGPLGFTDQDPEGMVVEGFDQMATFALKYNYPYYREHMEALGYEKVIDWLEYRIYIPEQLPERIGRIAAVVEEKYGAHVRKLNKKILKEEHIIEKVFDLINRTYKDLYDYTVLPQKSIDSLAKTYLAILDLDFISAIFDRDENLIAVGITMASIVRAMQKSRGRLFPFGWFHLLKSMKWKHEEAVELLLIAIEPEWANRGLLALIFKDLIPFYAKGGFRYGESNGELETNTSVQGAWNMFEREVVKRRRVYGKPI